MQSNGLEQLILPGLKTRYCARVSEHSYKTLTSDNAPLFLLQDKEIAKLQSIVELLQDEISTLKRSKQNNDQWLSLTSGAGQPNSHLPPNLVSLFLAPYLITLKLPSLCPMPPTIMIVNIMLSFTVWRNAVPE